MNVTPSEMTKFQLISAMRRWIERLSAEIADGRDGFALSASEIQEILATANDIRLRIEMLGMVVDWTLHDQLKARLDNVKTGGAPANISVEIAEDIIALYRKLIGVLAFMLLRGGEIAPDGTVIFEPAPSTLWDLP